MDLSFQKILLKIKTKTKTEKEPTYAIFSKSGSFEDIKYDTEKGCCGKVRKSAASVHQQHLHFSSINASTVKKSAVLPTSLMSFLWWWLQSLMAMNHKGGLSVCPKQSKLFIGQCGSFGSCLTYSTRKSIRAIPYFPKLYCISKKFWNRSNCPEKGNQLFIHPCGIWKIFWDVKRNTSRKQSRNFWKPGRSISWNTKMRDMSFLEFLKSEQQERFPM